VTAALVLDRTLVMTLSAVAVTDWKVAKRTSCQKSGRNSVIQVNSAALHGRRNAGPNPAKKPIHPAKQWLRSAVGSSSGGAVIQTQVDCVII